MITDVETSVVVAVVASVVVASTVITALLSGKVVLGGTVVKTVEGTVVVIISAFSAVLPQTVKEKITRSTHIKTFNFFIFYSIENIPYFILKRLNLSVIGLFIKNSRMPVVIP